MNLTLHFAGVDSPDLVVTCWGYGRISSHSPAHSKIKHFHNPENDSPHQPRTYLLEYSVSKLYKESDLIYSLMVFQLVHAYLFTQSITSVKRSFI
jgi:hypothetical protein